MVTVKKLLSIMRLDEYTRIFLLEEERRYYLGGGYQPDVLRRFGSKRVCSTKVVEDRFLIFVKQ